MWDLYDSGATIGTRGSEGGIVVLDDEHSGGARITLESDCPSGGPFAVTCGVYGHMVHTRFFGDEGEARTQYGQMRGDLAVIVEQLSEDAEDVPDRVLDAVGDFVMEKYP